MYIKDWFKPIFLLSLTGLPRTLKFLIPVVDFAPLPSLPMLLAKLRLLPTCMFLPLR